MVEGGEGEGEGNMIPAIWLHEMWELCISGD